MLLSRGPDSLAQLRRALSSPDPEVRRRVLRIVPQLETARDLAPTRITATFKNAPIEKVIRELERKAGHRLALPMVALFAGKNRRFTGEFRDATFWEAADQLAQRCDMRIVETMSDDNITSVLGFVPTKRASPFTGTHGAFRIVLKSVAHHRQCDFDEDEAEEHGSSVVASLKIQCEPRLRMVYAGEPISLAAYDDRDRSMLPPLIDRGGLPEFQLITGGADGRGDGTNLETQVAIELGAPSEGSRRIKLLKGIIPVMVLVGHKETILLDKLEKGRTYRIGDRQFNIVEVRRTPKGLVTLGIKIPPGVPQDGDPLGIAQIEFRDNMGRKCEMNGIQNNQDENVYFVDIAPSPGKTPSPAVRMVHRLPLTRTILIPFEFRNVPLP